MHPLAKLPRPALSVEIAALARLAAPIVLTQVGLMAMGVVDTMMVGHVSADALSAVALGNLYHWGLLAFGQGILFALDPLVSQSHGADDRDAVGLWFQRGLVVALALSALFIVALQFAAPVLHWLGEPPELVPIADAYVRACAPGVPAFFLFVAVRQTLQGINIVRPLVIAVVVGNLANVVGNYALIYGHFGMPPLGAPGSGVATTLCRFLMAAVLIVAANRPLRAIWRRPARALLMRGPYLLLMRIGLPMGIQVGLEVWVFVTVSLLMGRIGSLALASHQIAINLASLSFMLPLGIGAAAATRVGNAIGRRDHLGARRSAWVAVAMGVLVMIVSALAFSLAPAALARLYSPDARVIEAAVALIPIAALFQVLDGAQAVACGVLRGAADTRVPTIINFVGYWILGLPLSLTLAFHFGQGPRGLWWGLTVALAVVAILLVLRVRSLLGSDRSLEALPSSGAVDPG